MDKSILITKLYSQELDSNNFARSLRAYYTRHNTLSDKQFYALDRMVNAPSIKTENVDLAPIKKILDHAHYIGGLKNPKFRLKDVIVSRAKDNSRNPDALYITENAPQKYWDERKYFGKISGGKFTPSRDCTSEIFLALQDLESDPYTKAVNYGKWSGQCSCCGKTLTDPKSLELGIGPICIQKFGLDN